MSKEDFEKILIENQKKNEESINKIKANSKKFEEKFRSIIASL